MEVKTIQQIKDEVALKEGYARWFDLLEAFPHNRMTVGDLNDLEDIITQEYAKQLALAAWISVKDILPKEDERVIACDSDGYVEFSRYEWSNGGFRFMDVYHDPIYPTHWMPLPEPPHDFINQQLHK